MDEKTPDITPSQRIQGDTNAPCPAQNGKDRLRDELVSRLSDVVHDGELPLVVERVTAVMLERH